MGMYSEAVHNVDYVNGTATVDCRNGYMHKATVSKIRGKWFAVYHPFWSAKPLRIELYGPDHK